MERLWKKSLFIILFLSLFTSWSYAKEVRILMLYSWFKDMPWQTAIEKGLKDKISKENIKVTIFEEYIDASRLPVDDIRDSIQSYYRARYSKKNITMIVSESFPAAKLMEEISGIFPGAERLSVQAASDKYGGNETRWKIIIDNDFKTAVESLVKIYNPNELAVICETGSKGDLARTEHFRNDFAKTGLNLKIRYVTGSNLNEIISQVSTLPPKSAIFYLLYFHDENGKRITPFKAVEKISKKVNAPIFSHWNTLLGSGVVGGYLISGKKVGESIGDAINSLAKGEEYKSEGSNCFEYLYDWNQLKKWGIKKEKLPENSKILFYTPGIFETYPLEMTVLFTFIGILVILSGALGYESQRRKKVSRKLKESRKRLNDILTANPDPVLVYDEKGKVLFLNPEFENQLGWTSDDLDNWSSAFAQKDYKEIIDNMIREVILENKPRKKQIRGISKDGTIKDFIAGCASITDTENKITGIIINLTDISEQKKLELQLQQAQKMESVGRLAGGVAHDFNNMLSIIIGNAEIMLDQTDDDDSGMFLNEIMGAALRSSDLVKQLLAFARKQTISPKILDLNKTTENMLNMLQRLIGEDIGLTFFPCENIWPVKIDPSQIDQVLVNLCVNARDAIGGTGKIVIETKNVTLDNSYFKGRIEEIDGDYVKIIFSDNGCGFDSDTKEKLFEPFYTTKARGKGTGLGLSTVFGIITQNSGFINVYSEVGKGTTFHIYFPRFTGDQLKTELKIETEIIRGGDEVILIVEDEKGILGIASTIIRKLGYNVIEASSPEEALKLLENDKIKKVDLLITDLVMPKMNGKELSEEVGKIFPSMKCLYMSGYTANIIAHHGVLDEGVNFINKPFSGNEIAGKIREILDS